MWAQKLVGPREFRLVDVPMLTADDAGEGEVLLRVLAGGVCGSDLPAFAGAESTYGSQAGVDARPGFPMHEVVGEVLASRDRHISVGSLVVGWDTGFAALAERTVTRGSDLAEFDQALAPHVAVMLQPLACVLYAVEQLGDLTDRSVAVLGQGPIGLLFSHVLKTAGAASVVGVDRVDRSASASDFRVDLTVCSDVAGWVACLREGDRPDVVVEAIGHQVTTLDQSINAVAPTGLVYYFGVPDHPTYPVDLGALFRKNATLKTGITLQRRRMLSAAGAYLRACPGLATSYVTHVVGAALAQEAYERAAHPTPGQHKITVSTSS